MADKSKTVRNLIDAHSWLGVIVSVPLFIVFWTGSIALFRQDIALWAQAPHAPIERGAPDLPLEQIVESKLSEYRLNAREHLTLQLPGEHELYLRMYIDLQPEEGDEGPEQVADLVIDPKTGRTVAEGGDFQVADFIYQMHYDLKLPGGMYVVGIVTLYFLVLILSGILIHARKMASHFFAYRHRCKRTKLLDIHNVIGVMSLPYTLMYALTGLIFNLSIVYQIAFAVFLYQGDQEALLADAGYVAVEQELSGIEMPMAGAYALIDEAESRFGAPASFVRFYNYGDENAHVQLFGEFDGQIGQRYEAIYRIVDGSMVSSVDGVSTNAVQKGLDVIAALHFGSFAGVDLRLLYFILGMGVSGMIVVGNLLWLEKRTLQGNVSPLGIRFARNLSIAGFGGTVLGTATALFAERVLPAGMEARGDWTAAAFALGLAACAIAAFSLGDKRFLLRAGCFFVAGIASVTVAVDWVMFRSEIASFASSGSFSAVGVDTGLAIAAVGFAAAGSRLADKRIDPAAIPPETSRGSDGRSQETP